MHKTRRAQNAESLKRTQFSLLLFSAFEVTTLWRYTNLFIIFIITNACCVYRPIDSSDCITVSLDVDGTVLFSLWRPGDLLQVDCYTAATCFVRFTSLHCIYPAVQNTHAMCTICNKQLPRVMKTKKTSVIKIQ